MELIVSSPLQRTLQTAELIGQELGGAVPIVAHEGWQALALPPAVLLAPVYWLRRSYRALLVVQPGAVRWGPTRQQPPATLAGG